IQLLEDLRQRSDLPAEDRFLLAQMYEGRGKEGWATAREILARLVAERGSDPAYVAHLAEPMLDHGETGEATRLAGRLEDLEKGRRVGAGSPCSGAPEGPGPWR